MKRILVLISGSGSNLQALLDMSSQDGYPASIVAVISNRADAYGLERARLAGVPALCLNHRDYASREAYDKALMACIDEHQPDLVVLAGFMRILTEDFTRHYSGRLLNIHPSLLPKFKGLHTHARALEAGEQWHGASVHFVTAELDGGPVIIQGRVAIDAQDTADTLAQRVHQIEHQIYPQAVTWFCQDRLQWRDGQAWLDGQPLPAEGIQVGAN
ncbi:phosphoribosylglycinamide formyltransferase [Balneatrix alpica]|uniref:phosphoribosylglycinamide formyltransferase n=1 Tax=Balneatrix alpica TaxID=75684 RepID=UPI00273A11AF|nr:phosphoribosylglycinamide formyltransferase [Balneatrix alpica]